MLKSVKCLDVLFFQLKQTNFIYFFCHLQVTRYAKTFCKKKIYFKIENLNFISCHLEGFGKEERQVHRIPANDLGFNSGF